MQSKLLFLFVGVLVPLLLGAQNNLIPEFTIDGTVKTFRETASPGGVTEAVQRTFSRRTPDAVETTLVQELSGGGRVEFYVRIREGLLFDVGGRNEGGGTVSVENVVEPLSDYSLRPVLDSSRTDQGTYEQVISSGGTVLSTSDVETRQRNRFIGGFETVTVPAGTFTNAVRVEVFTQIQTTTPIPGLPTPPSTTTTINSTQWLVNGVGLVKQESSAEGPGGTQTTTRELLSYSVPGTVPAGQPQVVCSGSDTILPLWSAGSSSSRLGSFAALTPTGEPEWYESSFFGLSYLPDDPTEHDGFVWTERFGWMKFERDGNGNTYLYVPLLRTWMNVREDGSFYSFDFRTLTPTGIKTYRSPFFGNVTVGEFNGWIASDRFGWVWAARNTDGVWFWSEARQDWLGITEDGGIWSTRDQRFL